MRDFHCLSVCTSVCPLWRRHLLPLERSSSHPPKFVVGCVCVWGRVTCVMCHMSHVTCHVSQFFSSFFLLESGGVSWWRVCYLWGLPRLAFRLFTESAHWADSVIESQCPSVCMSVCLFVPCEEGISFHWRGLLHIPPNLGWGVCVCVGGVG